MLDKIEENGEAPPPDPTVATRVRLARPISVHRDARLLRRALGGLAIMMARRIAVRGASRAAVVAQDRRQLRWQADGPGAAIHPQAPYIRTKGGRGPLGRQPALRWPPRRGPSVWLLRGGLG
jgi:hypothetical protein